MNSDVEYTVTWACDGISADSPMDAARKALEMHRDPHSIATVFTVSWKDPEDQSHCVEIDLLDQETPRQSNTTDLPLKSLLLVPQRWKRNQSVGCLIDGSRGIYMNNYLSGIAKANGWSPKNDVDAAICYNTPHGSPEDEDAMVEIADEIVNWLNEHVAPEGCYIDWHEGELFCWPVETWCEFTGEPCNDSGHKHP